MSDEAPAIDTSDPTYIDRSAREKRRAREREIADLGEVLNTAAGQRLVWRLLSAAGIYRQSYVPDSGDTAFNEGRRSIGLMLIADIHEAWPHRLLDMVREAQRAK